MRLVKLFGHAILWFFLLLVVGQFILGKTVLTYNSINEFSQMSELLPEHDDVSKFKKALIFRRWIAHTYLLRSFDESNEQRISELYENISQDFLPKSKEKIVLDYYKNVYVACCRYKQNTDSAYETMLNLLQYDQKDEFYVEHKYELLDKAITRMRGGYLNYTHPGFEGWKTYVYGPMLYASGLYGGQMLTERNGRYSDNHIENAMIFAYHMIEYMDENYPNDNEKQFMKLMASHDALWRFGRHSKLRGSISYKDCQQDFLYYNEIVNISFFETKNKIFSYVKSDKSSRLLRHLKKSGFGIYVYKDKCLMYKERGKNVGDKW